MILDTSALLAILLGEADAPVFIRSLRGARRRLLPASVYLESGLKLVTLKAPDIAGSLDLIVERLALELLAFTPEQAREAVVARTRFGKGQHALNFGDCMVYAAAKVTGEPLLYKGEDFARTDVRSALA